MRPSSLLLLPLLALSSALLAGCSDDPSADGPAGSPPTSEAAEVTAAEPEATTATTEAPTTETVELSDEDAVLAAVEGYWATLFEASAPPDPDHPGLDRFLTGDQLEVSRSLIEERRQLGQAVRLPEEPEYSQTVETVDFTDAGADVVICAVDDGELYDVLSDTLLNGEVSTSRWRLAVVNTPEGWKVADSTILNTANGVVPCDSL